MEEVWELGLKRLEGRVRDAGTRHVVVDAGTDDIDVEVEVVQGAIDLSAVRIVARGMEDLAFVTAEVECYKVAAHCEIDV